MLVSPRSCRDTAAQGRGPKCGSGEGQAARNQSRGSVSSVAVGPITDGCHQAETVIASAIGGFCSERSHWVESSRLCHQTDTTVSSSSGCIRLTATLLIGKE